MNPTAATAHSLSNIAFIKYWGHRDDALRLPANGSISMNLAGLETITTVYVSRDYAKDEFSLNGEMQEGASADRVSAQLDHIRRLAGSELHSHVISENNFPTGAGIASSASAFAALSAAGSAAFGVHLDERTLTRLARLGSGSACRSIPGGFVEWHSGDGDESSYAETFASEDHWELVDLVAIVSDEHKVTGSTAGHQLADTSPLQFARVSDARRRLNICKSAVLECNFQKLAEIIEQDAFLMHAVMMTSSPPLLYWTPATIQIIQEVRSWRASGTPVAFTIDAGPNVHVITLSAHKDDVLQNLRKIGGVRKVLTASPGGPTRLATTHLPHW